MDIQFSQLVQLLHLLLAQLKVGNAEILNDALFGLRFGEHDEAVLQTPSQSHLRNRLFVFLCNTQHCLVFEQVIITPGQWRVCLNCDSVLSAKLDGIVFPQKRVYFELVDRRFHF